jgi:hypothetical protein
MGRFFQVHYLIVFGGLVLGLLFGIFAIDARPAVLGWLFGAGAGLTGGAFIAAIASGQSLVSGPAPRDPFEGYEDLDELEAEMPHLLDDLPARTASPVGRNGAHEDDEPARRR